MLRLSFCRQQRRSRRGASAFEVALSLAVAAFLVVPVSFLLARASAHLEGNSLSLQGAVILQTWLDALQLSDVTEGSTTETVRCGLDTWLLSYHTSEPMLSIADENETASDVLVLVVAHALNEDHNTDVVAQRLMEMQRRRDY
jgi:hypothetical protein